MVCFSGEYECKIDSKSRLVLPSRLKAKLPDSQPHVLMAVRGFESCLVLYPMAVWDEIVAKVLAASEFSEENRLFQRSFLRGSTEIELDAQSRLLLPKSLIAYAQILSEATIVGVGNRMELWNPALYEQNIMQDAKQLSQAAERILGKPENPSIWVRTNTA
jgi:MraZ protein